MFVHTGLLLDLCATASRETAYRAKELTIRVQPAIIQKNGMSSQFTG
jgi:hypothetical protein